MNDKKNVPKRLDAFPTDGFALVVDGKIKSLYETSEAAFKAALALKQKFPVVQVGVFDAAAQTRTFVEEPEAAAKAPAKAPADPA